MPKSLRLLVRDQRRLLHFAQRLGAAYKGSRMKSFGSER